MQLNFLPLLLFPLPLLLRHLLEHKLALNFFLPIPNLTDKMSRLLSQLFLHNMFIKFIGQLGSGKVGVLALRDSRVRGLDFYPVKLFYFYVQFLWAAICLHVIRLLSDL